MRILWWMLGILALLCFSSPVIQGKETDDNPCGNRTLTAPTGQISVTSLPKGQNCTYTIIAANYTPQVALKFNKISLDPKIFNLTVYANSVNGKVIANLTQGSQDKPYSLVVSGYNVTVVVFSRTSANTTVVSSGFSASYDRTKCQVSESGLGGVISSPFYLPGNGSVNCTYNETNILPGYMTVVSFPIFNVSKGSVNITMGKVLTSLSGTKRPGDLFGAAGVTNLMIRVTFKNDTTPQTFSALYQTVDPRCSGSVTAAKASKSLSVPKGNQFPMTCYMQIKADDGKVYVSGQETSNLAYGVDSFVFYDGNSAQGSILGTLGEGYNWFVSSGSSMTVVANLGAQTNRNSTLKYKSDKFSMYYVLGNKSLVVDFDGTFVGKDEVMLQYVSKDPAKQKVKIEVIGNSTITDAVVTVLCDHGMVMYKFKGDSALFPVVMPSSRAMVMINNLGTGQKVSIVAEAVTDTDCNQLFTGKSGQISLSPSKTKSCNVVVNAADDVILDLSSVNLCKTGKLEIYQGALKTSQKVATLTAGNLYPVIPQMKFPFGSGPRLVWTDSNKTCTEPTIVGRYWTQNDAATCGTLSSGLTGTVSTPNFPNQYPLNVKCNWTLPAKNTSMMFLSVNSMQFNSQQNMSLQNSSTGVILAMFNGTVLPNDLIIPNKNLSMVFLAGQAVNGVTLTQAGQGAQISYKVLTCGGLVKNGSANISVPQLKNQSIECIWIIQVPENGTKKSVNIVSANFTVFGYKNASNGNLEVHDGGSLRDSQMSVNLTRKNATNLKSRRNIMLVRYTYTNATSGPFGVNISYVTFNCNTSMQCDNGICMHPEWLCDGRPQCADGKDEKNCNGSQPIPPVTTVAPAPKKDNSKKVPGFWIFVCLMLGIVVGIILTVAVPRCIKKFRQRGMSRASNYGSLHEDT